MNKPSCVCVCVWGPSVYLCSRSWTVSRSVTLRGVWSWLSYRTPQDGDTRWWRRGTEKWNNSARRTRYASENRKRHVLLQDPSEDSRPVRIRRYGHLGGKKASLKGSLDGSWCSLETVLLGTFFWKGNLLRYYTEPFPGEPIRVLDRKKERKIKKKTHLSEEEWQ